MTKFLMVKGTYRNAWKHYLQNEDNKWENFSKEFKEEFQFKIDQEQHYLRKYARPSHWWLNDQLGVNEFAVNMSRKHFNGDGLKYEYTNNLPSFKDILLERALKISNMGKKIQLYYSGGIDSTAVVLAFYEVCPKDQLEIIMGGDESLAPKNNPKLFKDIIQHLDFKFTDFLLSAADLSQYVYTTGCEADRLFGADGYTMMMQNAQRDGDDFKIVEDSAPTTDSPENWQWNWDRWWNITRHTYLTQSFRLLGDIQQDKINIENYQPLFFDKRVQQFAINLHIDKEHKWYNSGERADKKRYRQGKIWIRDFIFEMSGDREFAYDGGNTKTPATVFDKRIGGIFKPIYNVLAIAEDGTVVNRKNIMDYLNADCLTIDV